MLNKNITTLFACVLVFITACEKEDTKDVSTTLKVPTIELVGDEFMSVAVGATYTDPGATYTGEDGAPSIIQPTDNTVNTAEPGLYVVTYSKKSTSGIFETEAKRIVAVAYQGDPTDYSGTYLRAATGINAYITRLAPGFYKVQNPGGAAGHEAVVVYFIESALGQFKGPLQHEESAGIGDVEITDIILTDTGGSWRVLNRFYGTGLRTFVKQ